MDPKKLKGIIKYFMFILSGCVIFLTTIFGIYSSVFIQHTEYNYKLSYWINPINIIDFTKTHKHLNEENYIQKVELSSSILQPDKAEKKTYNYCFIVDVTKSLTSSEELYGYIKSKVDIEAKYDELSKICESALSSIVLHTLIAFETNSDYDLWLYKGELTDKVWGNLKHINPFLLDDEKKDLDMTVYIKTKEALRVFNSEIDKNGDITTNIGKLFKSSFKKFDKDSIVLNIISDFKHEGDDEIALQQIESSINDIGDRIHQINLFVIGDTTGNKVLTALESTLGALDIYYYPYIFEDKFNLNENKIKSYSSTTIDQSQNQSISFYRPFSSKNNEDNYKSNIYINGFDNSYLLTLRNSTQKSVGKNPLIRLKMKDKTGFLRLNKMQELSADRIKMKIGRAHV